MNIGFITSSVSFGGASKILCFLANSFAQRGHNVSVANLKNTPNVTDFERALDPRIHVYVAQHSTRTKNISYITQLYRFFKKENADVLIGFLLMPNFYSKIVGDLLHIPSIISERGDPVRTGVGKDPKTKVLLQFINRSKGGVFQTDGAMKFYGEKLQKRGRVIPNPIFTTVDIPTDGCLHREKSVVSVGRLDNKQKRYDVMLEAFNLFSVRHPQYILKIYGRGNDEELIRTWVREKNLSSKVQFMGLSENPMRDIYNEGIFIITSDFEGISNSLLEAMAAGLPCVSTDHTPGGARLLIQDHENGLLAPIGSAEGLANALSEFADNPNLAENCGKKARGVLSRFAPERILDQWEEYIQKIVGDRTNCKNKIGI